MTSTEEFSIEWLNENIIRSQLELSALKRLSQIEIFQSLPSTNTYLMDLPQVNSGQVCMAEHQSAGKGRAGRVWISPLGRNIFLSLVWYFPAAREKYEGLSLVAGVAVIQGLEAYGVKGFTLKWPNDICYHRRKLGGVLIEMNTREASEICVVIGVGINLVLSQEEASEIHQPWIDLERVMQKKPERNIIVGKILNALLLNMSLFETQGLLPFVEAWKHYDALFGHEIVIRKGNEEMSGIATGIDNQGWLMVNVAGRIERVNSGEVSVRWQK